MDKLAFKITEVAEQTGLSRTKLYEEIAAGRLRVVKVGRRTLIPGREVHAWLDRLADRAAA